MPPSLDVLLVGADAAADRWSDELRRSEFEPSVRRVDSADEFRSALDRRPDVILASVAGAFTAADAMRVLGERPDGPPLIALGDTADRDDLLDAGARDVVGTEQLSRLGRVVRRVMSACRSNGPALRQETKLNRAHAALLGLARGRTFQGENLIGDLHAITEMAAHALEVARASVWLYDGSLTKIRCLDLYEPAEGRHSDGAELLFRDHPAYFLALEERRLIVAHDAHTDPQTAEYAPNYLVPLGITSMLDAAARLRGVLVGVICLEHIGPPRCWTTEEEVFVCALADLVSLALEASERQTAETALAESERRFRELFENTRDAVVLLGVRSGGRFVCEAINPAAESVSGFRAADVIGKAADQLVPAGVAGTLVERYRRCVETGAPLSYEQELPLPAGPRWFSTLLAPIRNESGEVYRLAAIARDITDRVRAEEERHRLEARLHQARKLEALGTLAGGVAHDFNNFLAGILGNAELLQQGQRDPADARDRVDQIVEISLRARDLVRQILTFSRNGKPARKAITLGPVMEAALKYLRVAVPPGVVIETDLPDAEPQVLADPTQMHQVVLNLCMNAVQAMRERGGTLTVRVDQAEVDAELASRHGTLRPGRYARLTVNDTGSGMTAETVERLFEPFFTTKPVGQGTGLGLAIVHGVVAQHEGAVVVSSQPGRGTTFQVYLPILERPRPGSPSPSPELPLGAGQRIMFVDDQPFMADYGQALLKRLGYRPEVYTDPQRALAAFRAEPGSYHAVITDYSMPGMTGFDLSQRLREIRSDLPVLLLTGFEGIIDPARAALAGIREIVPKPFTIEAVAEVLRRVMA